jgi:5'-nucleotidase
MAIWKTFDLSMTQILLTNDDGIDSPGLWAAAQALSALGYVHVVAPRQQFSAAGRSMPSTSDGVIQLRQVVVNGKPWDVYAVGGAPAQAVQHALLEVLPERPDLIVSGINYGENVGCGVTISGTVGAALEGAAFGIPSLAISLETEPQHHYSLSSEVDFSTAAHFTAYFGGLMMKRNFPPDVDVLKVEVPCDVGPDTPWTLTRLSRLRYFEPLRPERQNWETPGRIGYRMLDSYAHEVPGTDVYALRVQRLVSVTPLSLDLTSRVDLAQLGEWLGA